MEADEIVPERKGDILILEGNPDLLQDTSKHIVDNFPNSSITSTSTLDQCKQLIAQKDFDIVILDYDLHGVSEFGLVHQFKVKDYEPAVLVISESANPAVVNEINGLGCHRYIQKQGDWFAHLVPAIRQLLRIRRLEEENRRLVAQLTEAKMFLEDKNKRLDEFSATVAHDIRGPLGGISMKLEFILERFGAQMDPKLHTLLSRAFQTTGRVIDIVQAMYNYAKLGSKAAVMEEVDLMKLFEEVINDMSFDEKLDIKIGLGDLPTIWGNKDLLRRIFINLISNAVKYNDKQEIIINIGFDSIVEKTLGRFARIFVSDNGPGISEKEQKDIFTIFKRGVSHNKSEDGLGVGLSVVRRIAELHYGDISLESKLGEGCKFVLSLPVEKMDFLN